MPRYLFTGLFFWAACMFTACDTSEEPPSDDSESNSGAGVCEQVSDTLFFDASYNYSFSSQVNIEVLEMQEYPNVPYIDWSGLTKDIQGHEVSLEEIGYVAVIVWNLDNYDDFEAWLDSDNLDMEKLEAPVWLYPAEDLAPGAVGAYLSEFHSDGGIDVDAETYFQVDGLFPRDNYIFVVVAGRGKTLGSDAIGAAFIRPVQDETAAVDMTLMNESVSFTFNAVFNDKPYALPRDGAGTILDWTEMMGQENPFGQEFTPNQAGRVMLTFYAGKTFEDLHADFLDLEIIADKKYTYEALTPAPVPISALTEENGDNFSGFGEGTGTWLLTLWCTSGCNNPAPKFLTTVTPCP